jgi:hypothetical protein
MTRDQYAPTYSDARDVTARYGLIDRNLAKTKDLGNFANSKNSRGVFVGHHSVLSFDKAMGYKVLPGCIRLFRPASGRNYEAHSQTVLHECSLGNSVQSPF